LGKIPGIGRGELFWYRREPPHKELRLALVWTNG